MLILIVTGTPCSGPRRISGGLGPVGGAGGVQRLLGQVDHHGVEGRVGRAQPLDVGADHRLGRLVRRERIAAAVSTADHCQIGVCVIFGLLNPSSPRSSSAPEKSTRPARPGIAIADSGLRRRARRPRQASMSLSTTTRPSDGLGPRPRRAWRLLPLLGLGYGVAYMDRVNISFAAPRMNADLHFSATVYGLGGGLFFLAYALFEVPSNLVLVRVGRAALDRADHAHLGPRWRSA